jgi:hypothetical protein
MKTINIPRPLTLSTVASVLVAVVTAGGFAIVEYRSLQRSQSVTVELVDDMARSNALLEKVNATRGTLQRMLRMRDPDELEKAVAEFEAARKAAEATIKEAGDGAVGVKTAFDTVAVTERGVLNTLLQGDLASASEKFLETASAQYVTVEQEILKHQVASRDSGMKALQANADAHRGLDLEERAWRATA